MLTLINTNKMLIDLLIMLSTSCERYTADFKSFLKMCYFELGLQLTKIIIVGTLNCQWILLGDSH